VVGPWGTAAGAVTGPDRRGLPGGRCWLSALAILLACLLLGGMLGCAGSTPTTTGTGFVPGEGVPDTAPSATGSSNGGTSATTEDLGQPENPPPTKPGTPTHPYGSAALLQGMKITVRQPAPDPAATPVPAGRKVVVTEVTLENTGTAARPYSPLDFNILDQKNQAFDPSGPTSKAPLGTGELAPGAKVGGAVAFSVPLSTETVAVLYQPSWSVADVLFWK
jgi:hypothetical protein